ncbi:MAG: hypothetical protein HZY79_15170 [Rhodoblastus sp.]|nr:MAG: hypothetical protein HZY79_15170 [Rhodoblastus sp.]
MRHSQRRGDLQAVPASAAASIVLGTWGHLQTDFAHVLGAVALPSFNGPLDRVGPLMRPLVRAPQRLFEQEIDEADSDDLAGAYSRFLSAHQLALAAIDEEVRHVPIAADFMSGDGPSEKVDRWLVSTLQSVLNERLDRLDSPHVSCPLCRMLREVDAAKAFPCRAALHPRAAKALENACTRRSGASAENSAVSLG